MKKRRMFFRMITASLMRRRSRMLIALLAIAIGATILSGLVTIYHDVPRQLGAEFRNYGANMIFTAADESFTMGDVEKGLSYFTDSELVGVAPYRYESVRIREIPVMAAGTDMEGAKKASPYWQVEGEWPSEDGQLMIGAGVADSFRLKMGDAIEVTYTPENAAEDEYALDNYIDFEITGILDTGGSEENYVYMSLADLETLTGVADKLDVAELSISSTSEKLAENADKISQEVPAVSARMVKRVAQSETTVLTKLQALVLLVTVVVLALTMICVATTMTAVVTERRKEIGLRKALGASDMSIIEEFMGEGLMLGGIGGILGSLMGFGFAQFVSVNVFNSSISFRPILIPITLIVSIVVTGAACVLPIRSATDVDPALVLKGE